MKLLPEDYAPSQATEKELICASIYYLMGKVEAIKVLRFLEPEMCLANAKNIIERRFPSGEESARGLVGGHVRWIDDERKIKEGGPVEAYDWK